MAMKRFLLLLALIAAIVIGSRLMAPSGSHAPVPAPAAQAKPGRDGSGGPASLPTATVPSADRASAVGFRNHQLLVQHFEKHGREFPGATIQDYLAMARALRDRPSGGPVLEIVRDDGVITRFDRNSGAFIAFEPEGVIRTYFRPRDGEAYFRRQARRTER